MNLYLKKLSKDDSKDVFEMLKTIEANENEFKNPVKNMNYKEFKEWLIEQENWSNEINLPKNYVGQTIFWLYDIDKPVGIGKIRHRLTDYSRQNGGNIGYAISANERGKGYGKAIIKLLIEECESMGIEERLLTVEKYNPISKHVIEKSGGIIVKETTDRWYLKI